MIRRVLIADDHGVVRDGLKSLIDAEPDLQVVAEANDGIEAFELAQKHRPDVVVMDLGMPRLNGVDATRRVREALSETRVLALSMHSERRFVLEALTAGANGYLLKDCMFGELASAIRSVAEGRTFLSPEIAGMVVDDLRQMSSGAPSAASQVLAPREREIVQFVAEGASAKEMATILHLSVKTVEAQRRQIMEKLGIDSLAGLVKYAIREGISPLED